MSVQLTVFPQSFNGLNSISGFGNEQLVDGINFEFIDTATSYDAPQTNSILGALTNQPPTFVNQWYKFRSTHSGSTSLPSETNGILKLDSNTTLTQTGVYQKLSSLTVNQTYTITINVNTPASSGFIIVSAYNGTSIVTQQLFGATSSLIEANFVANSIFNTIVVTFSNTAVDSITIDNISVKQSVQTPNEEITNLGNGQVVVDLYEDETIPLTLSVDNFKNVAEKTQSYSKAFDLPATKRNNKIFDHIFDITRTADSIAFNPYLKTQCELKQDGFILFEGYLRLIDISDKDGEISYNVNLYSEAVALADVLKDRTFADLDFTELNHRYNKSNIKLSYNDSPSAGITYLNTNTSGFRHANDTVKYPFCDWNHQIPVADGFTGNNSTLGMPELISLEQAFRPFIQIKYLIQKIFQDTPFTFTSDFFDTSDFKKLYMDFNWGSDEVPNLVDETTTNAKYLHGLTGVNFAATTFTVLKLTSTAEWTSFFGQNISLSNFPPNYNQSTNIITATVNNELYIIDYNYAVENTDSSDRTVELQWNHEGAGLNNTGSVTIAAGDTYNWTGQVTVLLNAGQTLKAEFKSDVASKVKQSVIAFNFQTNFLGAEVTFNFSIQNIVSGILLNTLRGDLKQYEFFKGIMTMFNLVAIPDKSNPNNILIEPYGDVFINNTSGTTLAARSIAHDWTEKIDVTEIKLTPLTDLNKVTKFLFVEDEDDYAFRKYKNAVGGHLYGSKIFDASAFTVLEGEEKIEAAPFAATIVKPLMPQYGELIIPTLYAMNEDGTSEGFENSPRILYNNGKITMQNSSFYIPEQNGLSSENTSDFLQFSHLSTIPSDPTSLDFHFGECQYFSGVGSTSINNLFNTYWLPYFNELYNSDTRIMTLKIDLSASDISTFNLYDTVFIKNRQFRVNKIDYKPNDLSTVEFILIP